MRLRLRRAAAPAPRKRRRLAPAMRRGIAAALAVAAIVAGYGAVRLSGVPAGPAILARASSGALALTARLGFVVSDIEVEGRRTTDIATIMAALSAQRGTPILAVSPSRAQAQLESLPWVRSAVIERRLPGTLRVILVERQPLAVWQHDGRQQLIDRHGEVIAVNDLSRFAKLPTVVGADAARHAAALLDMLALEPKLAARVSAAVQVDDRRWNLRVDHAIEILLPEEDPAAAWARLARLERTDGVLERAVRTIDLRLPDRVVLRVDGPPPGEAPPAKKAHSAGKST